MKKFLPLFISGFAFLPMLNAQTPDITFIQKKYKEVRDIIDAQEKERAPADNFTFVLKQNLPGSGPQTVTYRLYFLLEEQDHPKASAPYRQTLVFATKEYNIAAYSTVYEEYLFSDGKLIFSFMNEKSDSCRQQRFYFKNQKPILVRITDYADLNCKKLSKETKHEKNFPGDILKTIESKKNSAKTILSAFDLFKL